MSVPLTVGGVTFNYPQQFDRNWGPTLTGWSTAVTNVLAAFPSTGVLTLSPYPSSTVNFANATNTGFLALTINGSNQLTFNGTPIGASASLTNGNIFVGNVSNQPADVSMSGDITISNLGVTSIGALKVSNSQIAAAAAIAFTKLASTSPYYWYVANSAGALSPIGVTASRVVITDANGLPSASSVTPTTLAYLDATSSVQGQLNGLLPLSGGTLSGSLSMASNKITGLASGAASGEAVQFGQLHYFQVISFVTNSQLTTLSSSYVDTPLTQAITVTHVNRVKITCSFGVEDDGNRIYYSLSQNGQDLAPTAAGFGAVQLTSGNKTTVSFTHLSNPVGPGTITYTVIIKSAGGSIIFNPLNNACEMILEEVI